MSCLRLLWWRYSSLSLGHRLCAPGFGGNGFQNNSDADVGVVRVHTTLSGHVDDGRYSIHVNTGVGTGADPFVDVAGGQITYGQDFLVYAEDGFTIGVGNTTPSMSITPGQANITGGSPTAGFVVVNGSINTCCQYGCSNPVAYTQVLNVTIGPPIFASYDKPNDIKTCLFPKSASE